MKFGNFIDILCHSDRMTIRIWLFDSAFDTPIAMIQPEWQGVKNYSDREILSIRIDESNDWVIDFKIVLEPLIYSVD